MTLNSLKALGLGMALSVSANAAFAAECIAPANPGGGWDFTCRQIGKILFDIGQVDQPVQVTNLAGAGGGLAFSTVVNERNDDPELIVAASSATTTRLAQNAYGGATADQVRWVGAIGADPGVIVVAADSPYQNLKDLIDAIKADPASVAFAGGSAVGGFDHMKPLQVLLADGFTDITKVKYIGVDGGADAITQTIGGFTQAMTGDMSAVARAALGHPFPEMGRPPASRSRQRRVEAGDGRQRSGTVHQGRCRFPDLGRWRDCPDRRPVASAGRDPVT